ncbi:biotin--[acetyl-CoA-carboxylase] ligase [Gemmatimonadota bacterium]
MGSLLITRETWTAQFVGLLERAREQGDGRPLLWAGDLSGITQMPGAALHYHQSLPSTNELLRSLVAGGATPGTVVMAGQQTAGRGRHGRSWYSPPGGGRYCSLLLEPGIIPERAGWITLAAALALVRAGKTFGADLQIKWPNDIECGGRKIAGVLAEMISQEAVTDGIVLGIGVNIDWSGCDVPDDVLQRGGTLRDCTGDFVDGDRFIAHYLWEARHIVAELEKPSDPDVPAPTNAGSESGLPPAFSSEVMAHMGYLGETVTIRLAGDEIRGICTGLTSEGFLELDGGRRVVAGELITHTETV